MRLVSVLAFFFWSMVAVLPAEASVAMAMQHVDCSDCASMGDDASHAKHGPAACDHAISCCSVVATMPPVAQKTTVATNRVKHRLVSLMALSHLAASEPPPPRS